MTPIECAKDLNYFLMHKMSMQTGWVKKTGLMLSCTTLAGYICFGLKNIKCNFQNAKINFVQKHFNMKKLFFFVGN